MVDANKIIETYERLEGEAGGIYEIGPEGVASVIRSTAKELDISYDDAADVLTRYWGGMLG